MKKYFSISLMLVTFVLPKVGYAEGNQFQSATSFETAVVVDSGIYNLGDTRNDRYLSVNAEPGRRLDVLFTGTMAHNITQGGIAYVEIFSDQRELVQKLDSGAVDSGNPISMKLSIAPGNTEKASKLLYIKVSSAYANIEKPSIELKQTDVFDIGTNQEAGDSFDNALEIKPGSYSGYMLYGDKIGDDKDVYKITLSKNKALVLKTTPQSQQQVDVQLFNNPVPK